MKKLRKKEELRLFNSTSLIEGYSKIIISNRIPTVQSLSEKEKIQKSIIQTSSKIFDKCGKQDDLANDLYKADFFPFLYDDSIELLRNSIYHEKRLLEIVNLESERVKSFLKGKIIDSSTELGENCKSAFEDLLRFTKERRKIKSSSSIEKYSSVIMKHILKKIEFNIENENAEEVLFFDSLLKMFILHTDALRDYPFIKESTSFDLDSMKLDSGREYE